MGKLARKGSEWLHQVIYHLQMMDVGFEKIVFRFRVLQAFRFHYDFKGATSSVQTLLALTDTGKAAGMQLELGTLVLKGPTEEKCMVWDRVLKALTVELRDQMVKL